MKALIETYQSLDASLKDLNEGISDLSESFDPDMNALIEDEYSETMKKFDKFEIQVLLSGEYDGKNAILTFFLGIKIIRFFHIVVIYR